MRYCTLIGSTSSVTPWFSTWVSPSSVFSSNVNPYWKPEQPPPETNTRSMRSALSSSRISSPTFCAAASVNTSGGGGISVASGVVVVFSMILLPRARAGPVWRSLRIDSCSARFLFAARCDLGRRHLRRVAGLRALAVVVGGLAGTRVRAMDQLAVDLGADGHLDQIVIHITDDPRRGPEFHPFAGSEVAAHRALQHHVGHGHVALDGAVLADAERRVALRVGADVAVDGAVDVAAALEVQIALNPRIRADQRVDGGVALVLTSKHGLLREAGSSPVRESGAHPGLVDQGKLCLMPELPLPLGISSTLTRSGSNPSGSTSSRSKSWKYRNENAQRPSSPTASWAKGMVTASPPRAPSTDRLTVPDTRWWCCFTCTSTRRRR